MQLISIRKALSAPENNPDGWFYLPFDTSKWTLNTQGVFKSSFDYVLRTDEYLPREAKDNRWIETLDNASIEDVVENAKEQLIQVRVEDLFNAFVFYYKNDAFIEF